MPSSQCRLLGCPREVNPYFGVSDRMHYANCRHASRTSPIGPEIDIRKQQGLAPSVLAAVSWFRFVKSGCCFLFGAFILELLSCSSDSDATTRLFSIGEILFGLCPHLLTL